MPKLKSQYKILIAFLLNLGFSIYELIGGAFTHSTAIMSDAVHDFGDAISIGISYFLEKKSTKHPNANYTYGYIRYSLVGGMITTLVLLFGSTFIIYNAIVRLFHPVAINYDGMIILAIIGAAINFTAVYITRDKDSLNQESVNLHMLEDVLGWVVVLIGAIIMRFTDITYLDPILSIAVALFVLKNAWSNFISILDVFLEKTPRDISLTNIEQHLLQIPEVKSVHHLHVWSLDGFHNYATLHVVSSRQNAELKQLIKAELAKHHISHSTLELETSHEHCHEQNCTLDTAPAIPHTHHHHSHNSK